MTDETIAEPLEECVSAPDPAELAAELHTLGRVVAVLVKRASRRTKREVIAELDNQQRETLP
jgi:hypothetical protein